MDCISQHNEIFLRSRHVAQVVLHEVHVLLQILPADHFRPLVRPIPGLMAETGEVASLEFAVLTARTSNDEAVNSLQQLNVS